MGISPWIPVFLESRKIADEELGLQIFWSNANAIWSEVSYDELLIMYLLDDTELGKIINYHLVNKQAHCL